MGVELRSMQRKFHSMMGEMKPQIRPRFVVWLDERLAEFKVKGRMELSETLEDPQWIKDFYMSKRESKAAAIKEREARDAGSSTGSVHPKIETKSESSNGVAHPEDLEGEKEEKQEDYDTGQRVEEQGAEASQPEQGFQLVEVKREQIEEDDDDDMIIVGETIAPQRQQVSYPSQYNPTRQMYSGFGRSVGPFQRKRQRFGSIPQRPSMTMSSGNRFKSRFKQNFRSAPLSSTANTSFPSHSATSQSLYTSSPSSQSYHTEAPSYADDPQEMYEGGDTHVYASETSQYSGESLRIPPHLQAQAAAELQTGEEDYEVTEGDMYADYGDESYDSSYLADATDSSLIQYDEQGNAVIKGENLGGDPSMEPMPGTSSETQDDLQFIPSRLGKWIAFSAGHRYVKRRSVRDKDYWRCGRVRSCHGSLISRGHNIIANDRGQKHSHDPDPEKNAVEIGKWAMMCRMKEGTDPWAEIYGDQYQRCKEKTPEDSNLSVEKAADTKASVQLMRQPVFPSMM